MDLFKGLMVIVALTFVAMGFFVMFRADAPLWVWGLFLTINGLFLLWHSHT